MSYRELKWSLFRDLRNKIVAGSLCTSENIALYWWVNVMTPKEHTYLSSIVLRLLRDPIPKKLVRRCARSPAQHSPGYERGGEMLFLALQRTVCRPPERQGPRWGPLGLLHGRGQRRGMGALKMAPPSPQVSWQEVICPLGHLLALSASTSPAQCLRNWKLWQWQQVH